MYNLKIQINPQKVRSSNNSEVSVSSNKYYTVDYIKAAINNKGCDENVNKYFFIDDNGNNVYVYSDHVINKTQD